MGHRPDHPKVVVTLQTPGLQWPGQEWDISALLATGKKSRYRRNCDWGTWKAQGIRARYIEEEGANWPLRVELQMGRPYWRQAAEFRLIREALAATTCVLQVRIIASNIRLIHRTRTTPTCDLDMNLDAFLKSNPQLGGHCPPLPILEYLMAFRSMCSLCVTHHDPSHSCCKRAVRAPSSTGMYYTKNDVAPYRNSCNLEAFRCLEPWPVPGDPKFATHFEKWYHRARATAVMERNNELQRRVDRATFQVLSLARVLLRPAGVYRGRLPLEVLQSIVEMAGKPTLTDDQIRRLMLHSRDREASRTVWSVLSSAGYERPEDKAKLKVRAALEEAEKEGEGKRKKGKGKARGPPKGRVKSEMFCEARRVVLRDEWLWNGGFVWEQGYEAAKRELGWSDEPGTWPALEDLDALLPFLAFAPSPLAVWPHSGEADAAVVRAAVNKFAPVDRDELELRELSDGDPEGSGSPSSPDSLDIWSSDDEDDGDRGPFPVGAKEMPSLPQLPSLSHFYPL